MLEKNISHFKDFLKQVDLNHELYNDLILSKILIVKNFLAILERTLPLIKVQTLLREAVQDFNDIQGNSTDTPPEKHLQFETELLQLYEYCLHNKSEIKESYFFLKKLSHENRESLERFEETYRLILEKIESMKDQV